MLKMRLIDTEKNTPSMNMAIDEALLDSKLPVLRFYSWKPAGLSIGYFQKIKEIDIESCKKNNVEIVRRLTGGNAVLHDKELTYSFIIDEKELPSSVIDSYKFISKGIVSALRSLGLDADMNEDVEKQEKSAVCFNDPSWYEIIIDKKKIVGSAQTRRHGKLLQHGAILLDIDVEKYASLFKDKVNLDVFKKRITSINDELRAMDKDYLLYRNMDGNKLFNEDLMKNNKDNKNIGENLISNDKRDNGTIIKKPIINKTNKSSISKINKKITYDRLKQALINKFSKELNIEFINSELTEEEIKKAKGLEQKYKSKEWNYRR